MRTEAYGAYNAVKYGGLTVRAGFTTVRDFGGDVTVDSAMRLSGATSSGPGSCRRATRSASPAATAT